MSEVGEGAHELLAADPALAEVLVELAGQGGKEHFGEGVSRVGQVGGAQQDPQVRTPEAVGAGAEAGVAGLGGEGEVEVLVEQVHHRGVERREALRGRRPGPSGGGPARSFC